VQVTDGFQCGIPEVAAFLACRILGCCTQEFQVAFQNIFDPQENLTKTCAMHQRRECFPVVSDGRGHGLDEVVQLIEPGSDDGVA